MPLTDNNRLSGWPIRRSRHGKRGFATTIAIASGWLGYTYKLIASRLGAGCGTGGGYLWNSGGIGHFWFAKSRRTIPVTVPIEKIIGSKKVACE